MPIFHLASNELSKWHPAEPGGSCCSAAAEQHDRQLALEYNKHFQIVTAVDDALRHHCYRIRHDVYCSELGYEPTNQAGVEVDEHDRHSLHCLIRATHTKQFVGCARLVITDPADASIKFPFEKACANSLAPGIDEFINQNKGKVAEVSRVAVISPYRRGKMEFKDSISMANSEEACKHRLPHMTLGLYLAMTALARQRGIQHLFFLIERNLATSLEHQGWDMWQVGDPIEHNGYRIPYIVNLEHNIVKMPPFIRHFYEAIQLEVSNLAHAKYA
jgi:N-acyl amino acid synthase of PEP-CTERM/exosortase system